MKITEISGRFYDENNNSWDSLEDAEKYSPTLINCYNCYNCNYCDYCNYCKSCNYCDYCNSCKSCKSCEYCKSCESCNYCNYCKSCDSCESCDYCNYCKSCNYCDYCNSCNSCKSCRSCESCNSCDSFKENPQRFNSKKIGSRDCQTEIYWVGNIVRVVCGCFKGSLEEFEVAVKKTHKDNETHLYNYLGLIDLVKQLVGVEK